MANLIIEAPDDLVRSLEGIAAAQHTTVQELAVERLRSLVEVSLQPRAGSAAVLRALRDPPHPNVLDVYCPPGDAVTTKACVAPPELSFLD